MERGRKEKDHVVDKTASKVRQTPKLYRSGDLGSRGRYNALVRSWWRDHALLLVGCGLVVAGLASWGLSTYETRQTVVEVGRLSDVLRLRPHSRVADVGAGGGRFTLEIARQHLTDGFIYATEIDLDQLGTLNEAVRQAGIDNVTVVESSTTDTGLPPACCDAVFLRTVYHHLTRPDEIASDLFSAVREGGRLAVIDFPPSRWLSVFAPIREVPEDRVGHGVSAETVLSELTAAGFVLEERIDDWGSGRYCLVLRRPIT